MNIFQCQFPSRLAIYGPMIYMAPYVIFLMWENPLQGPLEGLAHGFAHIKNITYRAVPNNQSSIGSFMYMSSQEHPGPITGCGGGECGKIVHSVVRLYTVR